MSHQDHHEVSLLVDALERSKKNKVPGRGGFSCKRSTFPVAGTDGIAVDSWRFQDWDYKRNDLPTYSRGLFTTKTKNNKQEIVIRGYDKFFNVGEVKETEWANVENNTTGPYELSVKENGCIIFISGLEDGTLLVCSKHSTGVRQDVALSHALAGERWVERHLATVGKTKRDLAEELRRLNATAVGELCDDQFEEHVLEYPPEMAGLYIHGLNFNLPHFATLSSDKVHEFADTWGFKKAQYIMMEDLSEVKKFLEQCAETGSWDGRDTEGFVIRCKMRDKPKEPYRDWFFKYKFEEPYLMYRQWREVTKSMISGKPPRYRKHKDVTEKYMAYARKELVNNPKLRKEYSLNHGIIAMRDGFLASIGQKGSDIIARERMGLDGQPDDGAIRSDVVLVPIATIGCGKTTVARALVKLFDFGHVQNDDIEGRGGKPKKFAMKVLEELKSHRAVIADRNSHQRRERQQIFDDVGRMNLDATFVALHYVHEPKGKMISHIQRVTSKRVLDRGDNHQTIHANTKGPDAILSIMAGFIDRFEGVDTKREPDASFDSVIDLDPCASSLENLEVVISKLFETYPKLLGDDMPSLSDMQEAIEWAMDNTVTNKHEIGSKWNQNQKRKNRASQEPGSAPLIDQPFLKSTMRKRVEYFSIPVSSTVITSLLSSMFHGVPSEEAKLYNHLKHSRRIQPAFHVTLIHAAVSRQNPELWGRYLDAYDEALNNCHTEQGATEVSLGPVRVQMTHVVWDDGIMDIVVQILPSRVPAEEGGETPWISVNEVPHITIGTANPHIKPKDSAGLLKRWVEEDNSHGKVWQKALPEPKILECAVKVVLRKH